MRATSNLNIPARPPGSMKGDLGHWAIAQSLAQGFTAMPSREELVGIIRPRLAADHGPMRQSAIHEAMATVAVYFRNFAPVRGVRLVGYEVAIPGARLDLLFEHTGGALLGDEIKTGRSIGSYELGKLDEQVRAQTLASGSYFGERYVGTRALVLSRPGASYLLDRWGVRLPVTGPSEWKGVRA